MKTPWDPTLVCSLEWNYNKRLTATKFIRWKFPHFLLQLYFPSLPTDSTLHVFTDLILSIQFRSNNTDFWSVSPIIDTQMQRCVFCICKHYDCLHVTWRIVCIWTSSGVYSFCWLVDGEIQGSLINPWSMIIRSFVWRGLAQCRSGDVARPLVSKMCYCLTLYVEKIKELKIKIHLQNLSPC